MRGVGPIAIVAVLGMAGTARAGDEASAREHYKRGMKAYDLGHYSDAAQEFEAAYTDQDDPVLLFDLGKAYRFSGDYAAAIRSFKSYLRRVPRAENRAEVESRLAELQKLLDEQNRLKEKPAPPPEPPPP